MRRIESPNDPETGIGAALGEALSFVVPAVCLLAGALMVHTSYRSKYNFFPKEETVQEGFIAPSDLEIKLEDLDHNGEPETIIRVGEETYLLKYDQEGKPTIQSYELKPAEIFPK